MQLGYQELDVRAIAPSPTNPRKHFDEAALAELANSIAEQGVIQPCVVRHWPFDEYPDPDGKLGFASYEIIAGERRWRAAKMAGLDKIPAIVKDVPTRQVLEIQIIENLQRRDVNELEEADGYRLMMDQHGYGADELGEKVGKSKAYIYARLKLCDLGPEPRVALINGSISASVALLIARIPTYAMQQRATQEVVEGNMSARAAAEHIQQRYMLKLINAPWDLDSAALCPDAGACSTCPKNTATDRDQYADVAADVCTDPDCWQTKLAANITATAAPLIAAGHTVITGDKAKEWAPHGTVAYIHNGFLPLDALEYHGATETRRERIAGVLDGSVARTFIEDVKTGHLAECITREAWWELTQKAQEAAETPEDKAEADARAARAQAATAAAQAEARALQAYAAKLYIVTRDAYTLAHQATPNTANPTLRQIILGMLSEDLLADTTIEQYNLPAAKLPYGAGHDAAVEARWAAYRDRLATMQAPELLNLIADNECNPRGWPSWQWSDYLEGLREYAAAYGLDPDAIRAELEAEQAPQPPAAEAAKTPSTPEQAAPAPALHAPEEPQTPTPQPAAKKAARAPASKPAKPKAKATPAPAKATAKSSKSSSRASPAGGKGKTTTSPTAKAKKSAEVSV